MPTQRLTQFLDDNHIKYVTIRHSPAFTAAETAHAAHIPGKIMAKTVIVRVDGAPAMLVLPSCYKVHSDLLKQELGATDVSLVSEFELPDLFPGCETGAMPPFGNLFGLDTYAAESLAEDSEIAFNSGSHEELIRMSWEDYERLVSPKIRMFSFKNIPAHEGTGPGNGIGERG